jgi:predicted AAA+ superfamily ATPase
MLSKSKLGKTQARAKGIMNIKELEKVKASLSKIVRDFFLSKIVGDDDLDTALDENYETLLSGYEALLNIIKIYKEVKQYDQQ